MPFTPFHFGPGAAIKGAMPRYFSFSVFCFAQVLMDLEVLVRMAEGESRLHGYIHTYAGAVVVGLVSFLVGWPLCRRFLRWWSSQPNVPLKEYYRPSPEIRPFAAVVGAFIGTFSHVFLDSLMHADIRPLLPFSESNHLFSWVGPGTMHAACFILALFGAWICARRTDAS